MLQQSDEINYGVLSSEIKAVVFKDSIKDQTKKTDFIYSIWFEVMNFYWMEHLFLEGEVNSFKIKGKDIAIGIGGKVISRTKKKFQNVILMAKRIFLSYIHSKSWI